MQLHPRAVVPSRRAIIRSECARDRAPIHENMLIPMPPPPPAPPRHDSLHCSGLLAFFLAADLGLPMFLRVFVFGPPETFYFLGALSSARAATDRSATLDGSACSPSIIAHTLEAAAETPSPSATRPAPPKNQKHQKHKLRV